MKKRKIDIVVISDVHLGTARCRAEELLAYLSSIKPKKLILNGDIVDIGQLNRNFFPASHLNILKKLINMASKGTEVLYITGDRDRGLRKFRNSSIRNISIQDNLVLELDGKKTWFFHGDMLDFSLKYAKWMAKLGRVGYSLSGQLNNLVNFIFAQFGKETNSLEKEIKNNSINAGKHIKNFEKTVAEIAISNGYDYVVCGHIQKSRKEMVQTQKGSCTYLNSGDWVKNLTALEYSFKRWKIYNYCHDKLLPFFADEELKSLDLHELINTLESKKSRKRYSK
ncbi:UDP-2,3-diacylglucosamine diphosphatase [uncultured Eudoraea sp.]|uniref:UDP-2,3-diacylglucosamine diphosphatase n=1 Tax=uncultured Eudoraea sp. TaxID=1035614 RepID=UPI002615F600|nr:UDP-2,3-diacylglucosamine diphosphatase [uncultured Eudoraea sp.]